MRYRTRLLAELIGTAASFAASYYVFLQLGYLRVLEPQDVSSESEDIYRPSPFLFSIVFLPAFAGLITGIVSSIPTAPAAPRWARALTVTSLCVLVAPRIWGVGPLAGAFVLIGAWLTEKARSARNVRRRGADR
jgi:hypothetical protein